jgi:hypothetical protein
MCHGRLSGNSHAIANDDVVVDTGLAGQYHMVAQPGAAGDTNLGHQDAVLAHDHIVSDVHLIVYLRAPLDPGLPQAGAVYTAIGADLDIVVDLDDSQLWDLDWCPCSSAGQTITPIPAPLWS